MLRKFIGERYFCGLDIGDQTIKASIVEPKENRQFELLGVYEGDTAGFVQGSVTDLGELTASINAVLTGLMKNARIKVKSVQLGVGGGLIRSRMSQAVMPLLDRGNKVISHHDVSRIQQQARLLGLKMDELLLHDFPQVYRVDDVNRALNPVGLYGRKLEIETLVVAVNTTIIKNLSKAVNQAGFDVQNIFFTSYAATHTALDDFQMRQGCVLVDIGSSVTDIVIFKSGQFRFLNSIPLGSRDFTHAIRDQLHITFDLAEDIKKSYAVVRHGEVQSDEEILIKNDDGYVPVKKHVIADAIEPVMTDLAGMIKASIKKCEFCDQLNSGMIIGGGGSLISGLAERLEKETGLAVKMAKINFAARRMHNAAKFLAAVGLAHAGFDKSFGLLVMRHQQSDWMKGCTDRIKELYEEYF